MAGADGPGTVLSLEEVQAPGSVEEATTGMISDSRITISPVTESQGISVIVHRSNCKHRPNGPWDMQTLTASVTGGGELNTANDTASDPAATTPVAELTIRKSHSGTSTRSVQR